MYGALFFLCMEYWNIKNINFSLVKEGDSRKEEMDKQILERGFDDSETWSLRDTIALFIIPRLKRYQEIANDFLQRDKELISNIDKFLLAMELTSRNNGSAIYTEDEEKQLHEGLDCFPKVFMSLWW